MERDEDLQRFNFWRLVSNLHGSPTSPPGLLMLRKGSVSRGEMLADLIGGNFQRKHSLIYPSSEASEETCEDDIADDCIGLRVGKKRRLTIEQVRSLELSFETDNRLEPERKVLLATELGLQPRQVAVWFQNRRARWKTKQLEKDYNALKYSFDSLKTNYNALVLEKERLQAEIFERAEKLQCDDKQSRDADRSYDSGATNEKIRPVRNRGDLSSVVSEGDASEILSEDSLPVNIPVSNVTGYPPCTTSLGVDPDALTIFHAIMCSQECTKSNNDDNGTPDCFCSFEDRQDPLIWWEY
ncbi:hypothetical protein O6H91_07G057600 [Diphasiastrum complanatum]|uniref:Uncharacterized protein n=2 Tax=Diphasiastrum complanatum TaxID=34168 RepID=A0ACC2D5Z3_DIPCM|nr:hypothetical protein O6H91_07G057600 [Diphasiastrum complanatum]